MAFSRTTRPSACRARLASSRFFHVRAPEERSEGETEMVFGRGENLDDWDRDGDRDVVRREGMVENCFIEVMVVRAVRVVGCKWGLGMRVSIVMVEKRRIIYVMKWR